MHNMKYNFFFSYSRNVDVNIKEKLIYELERFGFLLWYDKIDVVIGNNINYELYNILEECKSWNGMIILIDATYLKKDWCIRELEYAIKHNIKIYPLLLNISKKDIPNKYNILKDLNLCTLHRIEDIEYAISKILYRFLSEFHTVKKYNKYIKNNYILKYLIRKLSQYNPNDPHIIFICDNIAVCFKYLLNEQEAVWVYDEQLIYNIIHLIAKQYYVNGVTDRFSKRIVIKATKVLLAGYFPDLV